MSTTSYQQWYVGQTFPSWDIPLTTDAGNEDLTGVTASTDLIMIFRNTQVAPPTDRIGTGTFTVLSVKPAEVLYKPSAADVASAFTGQLQVKCNMPPSHTSADQVVYDPLNFVITAD